MRALPTARRSQQQHLRPTIAQLEAWGRQPLFLRQSIHTEATPKGGPTPSNTLRRGSLMRFSGWRLTPCRWPVSLNVIGDFLALSEAAQTRTLDGADVHEHIPPALIGLDEAIALLVVEPLHGPSRHRLSFHGRGQESRAPERARAEGRF